jgi:hypothetical protein
METLGQSHHHTKKNGLRNFCGDTFLTVSEDDSYPLFQRSYNDELAERVGCLYSHDFES